jgi:homocitrate synthase
MCPPPDAPVNGNEEMVAIDTNQPSLPPPAQTGASTVATDSDAPAAGTPNGLVSNGEHSHPPPVKSHKGVYGRASDFLSNTSNWQVSYTFRSIRRMSGANVFRLLNLPFEVSRYCIG